MPCLSYTTCAHEAHVHIDEAPSSSLTRQIRDAELRISSVASEIQLLEKESNRLALDFQATTRKASEAIIAEVAGDAPSMFIVETPEASLDSVFVPRAGAMMRRFLYRSSARSYLIASVNLNREAMIPALFGVPSEFEVAQLIQDANWPALRAALNRATPYAERENLRFPRSCG